MEEVNEVNEVRELVEKLQNIGWHISVAESCTGGLLSAAIVNVPGASGVYEAGCVTYSNEAKMRLLGVAGETLKLHGAVSRETAAEMAEGAARENHAQIALATTGIAGPGGGSPDKPVGLVYIGCCVNGVTVTREKLFTGDRDQVRKKTVTEAIRLALECLTSCM